MDELPWLPSYLKELLRKLLLNKGGSAILLWKMEKCLDCKSSSLLSLATEFLWLADKELNSLTSLLHSFFKSQEVKGYPTKKWKTNMDTGKATKYLTPWAFKPVVINKAVTNLPVNGRHNSHHSMTVENPSTNSQS